MTLQKFRCDNTSEYVNCWAFSTDKCFLIDFMYWMLSAAVLRFAVKWCWKFSCSGIYWLTIVPLNIHQVYWWWTNICPVDNVLQNKYTTFWSCSSLVYCDSCRIYVMTMCMPKKFCFPTLHRCSWVRMIYKVHDHLHSRWRRHFCHAWHMALRLRMLYIELDPRRFPVGQNRGYL